MPGKVPPLKHITDRLLRGLSKYIALLCALLLYHAPAQAMTITASNYFPLEAGDSWTYRINGRTVVRSVNARPLNINGVFTTALNQSDGLSLFYTNDANGIRLHGERDPELNAFGTYSPPLKYSDPTATVGQRISSSGRFIVNLLGQTFNLNYSATTTFLSIEDVTVPAATYRNAAKFSTSLSVTGNIAGTRVNENFVQTNWVANRIGIVRTVDTSDNTTTELVSTTRRTPPPGTLQFISDLSAALEGRTGTLTIRRSNGNFGEISVNCFTKSGQSSATSGSDFTALVPGTILSWQDGESRDKNCNISTTDDAVQEANETVAVALSNPTGGAVLGTLSEATLVITDNDNAGIKTPQHDIDANSTSDIVVRNSANGVWRLYPLNGRTVNQSGVGSLPVATDRNWQTMGINDFNGDNNADVLLRNINTGAWRLYELSSRTLLTNNVDVSGITTDLNWQFVGAEDFTGDGFADIILRNQVSGRWLLYPMNGRTVLNNANFGSIGITPDLNWQAVATDDFNGDDRADILLRHQVTGRWLMIPLNGRFPLRNANFGGVGITPDMNWTVAGTGDFNGDGNSDLMLRHAVLGQWLMLPLTGRTVLRDADFGGVALLATEQAWQPVQIEDFTGDGIDDVLIRNNQTGAWRMHALQGRLVLRDENFGGVAITGDLNFTQQ